MPICAGTSIVDSLHDIHPSVEISRRLLQDLVLVISSRLVILSALILEQHARLILLEGSLGLPSHLSEVHCCLRSKVQVLDRLRREQVSRSPTLVCKSKLPFQYQ